MKPPFGGFPSSTRRTPSFVMWNLRGWRGSQYFQVHLKSHQDPSRPIKQRSNQSRWRMQRVRPEQHRLASDQSYPTQYSAVIALSKFSRSFCYFDHRSRYFTCVMITAWDEDKPGSLGNGDICTGWPERWGSRGCSCAGWAVFCYNTAAPKEHMKIIQCSIMSNFSTGAITHLDELDLK